jgi:hypothetical protein
MDLSLEPRSLSILRPREKKRFVPRTKVSEYIKATVTSTRLRGVASKKVAFLLGEMFKKPGNGCQDEVTISGSKRKHGLPRCSKQRWEWFIMAATGCDLG